MIQTTCCQAAGGALPRQGWSADGTPAVVVPGVAVVLDAPAPAVVPVEPAAGAVLELPGAEVGAVVAALAVVGPGPAFGPPEEEQADRERSMSVISHFRTGPFCTARALQPVPAHLTSAVMTELRGSTALVTGATGGLGHAIARALREEGCSLVVTGRQAEPLNRLAAEVGGRAVLADLSRRDELPRLVEEAGPLDIAVMNAALPASGELQEWEQEQIDRALEVNLANPIAMTRALLPSFLGRGSGHFVYISSLSGKVASKGAPLYSATKYGLRGFAHALRCDLAGTGVGCSVVNPGFVRDAGMFADAGTKLPPGVGTVSPGQVGAAVVKAIRSDRADVDVAPVALRLGATFGSLAPGISSAVQARFGGGISGQMVEGQRHKRV